MGFPTLVKRCLKILTQSCQSLTVKLGYADTINAKTPPMNKDREVRQSEGERVLGCWNFLRNHHSPRAIHKINAHDATLGRDFNVKNVKYTLIYDFEKAFFMGADMSCLLVCVCVCLTMWATYYFNDGGITCCVHLVDLVSGAQ